MLRVSRAKLPRAERRCVVGRDTPFARDGPPREEVQWLVNTQHQSLATEKIPKARPLPSGPGMAKPSGVPLADRHLLSSVDTLVT